jgi:transcriptional regulator with XRE-family HTH domain
MTTRSSKDTPRWRAARRVIDWYQNEGLTQVELATRSGKSQSFISELVTGKVAIPDHDMDRFAELLGVPVSALVGAEDGSMWSPDEHALLAKLHESANRKVLMTMLAAALRQERNGEFVAPPPQTKTADKIKK